MKYFLLLIKDTLQVISNYFKVSSQNNKILLTKANNLNLMNYMRQIMIRIKP